MLIEGSGQDIYEGGEENEAALPRLDALVSELFVQGLDDGRDLCVQQGHRAAEKQGNEPHINRTESKIGSDFSCDSHMIGPYLSAISMASPLAGWTESFVRERRAR